MTKSSTLLSKKSNIGKKFKPWRKGESSKAKSIPAKRSLKTQLRGKERFLVKLTSKISSSDDSNSTSNENEEKTRKLIETVKLEIDSLKSEIQAKQEIERQKKNATKYHQVKFFERQKLTRMERKAKKKLKEAKEAADFEDATKYTNELMQICMDQLYVAFYPNDKKYISIFANLSNKGIQKNSCSDELSQSDNEKIKKRRIEIKQDILNKIKNNVITKSDLMQKSWVNIDMLRKRDFDLSLAELPSCYQLAMGHDYCNDTNDKRKSSAAIAAVQNWEQKRKLDVKEDNKVDLIKRTKHDKSYRNQNDHGEDCNDDNRKNRDSSNNNDDQHVDDSSTSSSSSSSTSSSSTSSSSTSSSSSSSSSSDSDSDSDDNDNDNVANTKQDTIQSDEESLDDFLVDDTDQTDVGNIFAKAQREALTSQDMPYEKRKGDKSQGWQTQKQRPGEWKGDKHHKRFI